jgi:hypothetical protein
MCPNNLVGTVDLFMVTHHGLAQSNNDALIQGIRPRAALMQNGTRKGGAVAVFETCASRPGSRTSGSCTGPTPPASSTTPRRLHRQRGRCADDRWVLTAPREADVADGRRGAWWRRAGRTWSTTGRRRSCPRRPRRTRTPRRQRRRQVRQPQALRTAGRSLRAGGVPPQGGPGGGPGGGVRGGGGVRSRGHTPAYYIKVSAHADGTFTVTNTRNGFSKTYQKR